MITYALLDAGSRVLSSLFALIPPVNLDVSSFASAGTSLGNSLFGFDNYVPVTALMQASGVLILVWFFMWGWNGAVWIFHQFWGAS